MSRAGLEVHLSHKNSGWIVIVLLHKYASYRDQQSRGKPMKIPTSSTR